MCLCMIFSAASGSLLYHYGLKNFDFCERAFFGFGRSVGKGTDPPPSSLLQTRSPSAPYVSFFDLLCSR
jgi:hypothetical protein